MAMTTRFTARLGRVSPATAVALSIAVLGLVAGCGRSAPEGATSAGDGTTEPSTAGVQVVSEQPVITPAPTSSTVVTTPSSMDQAAQTYVIQSGDTLSVIAERFGVSIDALSQANGIEDVNTIRPGQELIIPAAG